jgi:hypothetical protein
MWGFSDNQMRRCRAETLYELEKWFAEEGWPSEGFRKGLGVRDALAGDVARIFPESIS